MIGLNLDILNLKHNPFKGMLGGMNYKIVIAILIGIWLCN
jgi:hypothetical protein